MKYFPDATRLQETAAVRKKIQDLCSRTDSLETIFRKPANDVAEKERRDELLQYVIASHHLDQALNSSKQVQGHRGSTAVFVGEVRTAVICRSCSGRRKSYWAPRGSAGDYL